MRKWGSRQLEAVARGNGRETRAFVQEFERPVFAVLSRTFPGQRELVEDLAQETFFRAFRALPRFDPDGRASLSTWLLTIASRLAIDEMRKRSRRPTLEVVSDDVADRSHEDDAIAVHQAIMSLTPESRLVVALRLVHGWSEREVAEALEIEPGTVKSRLSRARSRLREVLGAAS